MATSIAPGIAPRLPMSRSPRTGITSIRSYKANVRQQIMMLFLTSPGERIMYPDYGIGIKRYLFEPDSITQEIKDRVFKQVKRYMPHITLTSLQFTHTNHGLGLIVSYDFKGSRNSPDSVIVTATSAPA